MAAGENFAVLPPTVRTSKKKPCLIVEVELNDNTDDLPFVRTDEIAREVRSWLTDNFMQLKVGQRLDTHQSAIGAKDTYYSLVDNDLDVEVYSLFQGEDDDFSATQPGDEIHLNVTKLPHRALDGLWESLIYEDAIPESVLRVLIRMLKVSRVPHLNPAIISWQNLVLLYGPPGSGKTTLAQALAQKLSIRSTNIYSATKLIEVNSHTLLSKWFGESSKLVGRLFDTISSTSSDDSVLTIVIIDEVETLAGSREKATQANECGDAIRSTNELLQGLDRLRKRPNVIFLCTSNLKEIMDTAFIDRCGIKQYIDSPNVECAYEIFRSVINEFIKNHLVCFDSMLMDRVLPMSDAGVDEVDEELLGGSSPTLSSNSSPRMPSLLPPPSSGIIPPSLEQLKYIPDLDYVAVHLSFAPMTIPRELRTLARKAEGLSGRTLRRLPMLALAKYTVDEPCELQNLLGALKRVVEEENQGRSGTRDGCVNKTPLKTLRLSDSEVGNVRLHNFCI